MTDISFIIVNYNSLNYIKDLLKTFEIFNKKSSLFNGSSKKTQSLNYNDINYNDIKYEIIIFDNNSTDGSVQYIEKEVQEKNNIILIKSKTNAGFSKGSNEGAKIAKGKYLVFLNPDTKIIDDNLNSLINFFEEKEKSKEKIGVIGVKNINTDGSLQYSCRSFPSIATQFFESFFLFKIFKKSKIFGLYFMTWWDHENIFEVDWLSGSFMFIKKDVFNQVSGFDENFFMYSEDTDLCLRLKRKGFKNYYYPYYSIIHADSAIAKKNPIIREIGIIKSRRYYFKKNYSDSHAKIISFLYFIGILNRLFLNLILYIFTFKKSYGLKIKLYFTTLKNYF